MGFPALATTSAGMAFSLGKGDGQVSPEDVLAHCRLIVAATDLPVSADLEKGFGDSPESVAETIRAAAETGLAGCSIEDFTGDRSAPIFPPVASYPTTSSSLPAARISSAAMMTSPTP